MKFVPQRLTAVVLVLAVLSGCSDTSEPVAQLIHGRSADWVAGGGSSLSAQSADRRLNISLNRSDQSQVVSDDGALWVMGRGEVGSCAAEPRLWRNDRVSRIAPDGKVLDIDFGSLDITEVTDALSSDCPTIVSGPVSGGNGAVLVTVSSQATRPADRRWWLTYRITPDGVANLWEPQLPTEFRVLGLGRSASADVLVIGGYRKDWEVERSRRGGPVDRYQLFAVTPVTLESRAIEVTHPDSVNPTTDPSAIRMPWPFPVPKSLGLLSDGRLVYWDDSDNEEGLWIENSDGLMEPVVDTLARGVGGTGVPTEGPVSTDAFVGDMTDLIGGVGGQVEPGPNSSLLLTFESPKFKTLNLDKYRIALKNLPLGNNAQAIVDESAPVGGVQRGTVLVELQETGGFLAASVTLVNVATRTSCIWAIESVICENYQLLTGGPDYDGNDLAYYRLPLSLL